MDLLTSAFILLFALFLIILSGIMMVNSKWGRKFLESFASSAKAHYTEMAIRLVFGASLILHESYDHYGYYLQLLGWVVVITTIGLLVFPWRWHHKFAGKVIPPVIRFMKLYGLVLLISGAFLIWAV